MQKKRISVRELVSFVHNKQSIDNRRQSNHTALDGAKIHRKLQQSMDGNYQPEVTLKSTYQGEVFDILVEGRCDGVWRKDDNVIIDEIKSSEIPFEQLEEATVELFFAQAKIYAYIYASQNDLAEIDVMLRYYCTLDEKIEINQQTFQISELEKYYLTTLEEYEKWLVFLKKHIENRQKCLRNLSFPFSEFRPGQRDLAAAVYQTLSQEKRLFMEAPTGTGKTLATLFPALKAMGEYQADRIFYLTAKTITREVALQTMQMFQKQQKVVKTIEITAKEKVCFMTECKCNPDFCPFAKNYYQKQKLALWELLNEENEYTSHQVTEIAKKYECCPFELSLDLSLYSDVIVCDYNYLFDPQVYLKRFFESEESDSYFLVDEAHNLITRSREMYTKILTIKSIKKFQAELPKRYRKQHEVLLKLLEVCQSFKELLKGHEYIFSKDLPDELLTYAYRWSEYFGEYLRELKENVPNWQQNLYFDLMSFLKISEYFDDHFRFLVELVDEEIQLKLFCLDPAELIKQKLDYGKGSVLFSATFSPVSYYQNLLVGNTQDYTFSQISPFEQKQFQVMIADFLPMTYRFRHQMIDSLCELIQKVTDLKAGNYFCFFPSFSYMQDVYRRFLELYPETNILLQEREMNEQEKNDFLEQFVDQDDQVIIGFCVLGGVFSEGIDLKGRRLIGSLIVSVGLPQISKEQEELKKYFDTKNQQGYHYIYQLPGFNKVMQAAGRVIRTEQDQGIILLIDQRFSRKEYMQLYPAHWSHGLVAHQLKSLLNDIDNFWHK